MSGRLLRRIIGTFLLLPLLASGANAQDAFEELLEEPADAEWVQALREPFDHSAEDDELETDRDSFTPATTVVGRRRVITESSYSFIDGRHGETTHSYPELLARIGLTERLELRLGWNYEVGSGGSVSGADTLPGEEENSTETEREGGLLYGMKFSLSEQDVWVPQSAVILHATTPTSGPDPNTQFTAGYVCGWRLPKEWQLDAAMRYGMNSDHRDHFNAWAPSIVLKVPLHEQWNVHAEYFGIFTQGLEREQQSQYFSPGVHYLVTKNCELGVRVGWGLSDTSANFFSNVGIGLRF